MNGKFVLVLVTVIRLATRNQFIYFLSLQENMDLRNMLESYLGYVITREVNKPEPYKVQGIMDIGIPDITI